MANNFYNVSPFITNQSLASTFTSSAFYIGEFDHVGVQMVVTSAASLNGSIQIQRSVDGTSFDNFLTAESVTGNTVITKQIQDVFFGYIRLVYTSTAGTGTLNVKLGTVVHR